MTTAIQKHRGTDLQAYKSFDHLIESESHLPAPKTFSDVKAQDSRQLYFVINKFGPVSAVKLVQNALIKTCRYLNFEVTVDMITRAAEEIVDKYPLCKVADLKMFEKYLLSGSGDKKQFRLDTRELVVRFDEYMMSREEAFEAIRMKEKKLREQNGQADPDEDFKDFCERFADRLCRDYQETNKALTFDEFCALKYTPVDNPSPIPDLALGPQKLRGTAIRELAGRSGINYDERIKKEERHWRKAYELSGIQDDVSEGDYMRYRKTRFDNELRKELTAF